MPADDPAVSVCFAVKIDDVSLGSFNSCEGLGCEVVMEQREEGGNNGFVWQLPTRLKYPNVKFSRPITADTQKVAAWFASMTAVVTRHTAQIMAMRADGSVVAEWSLFGVVPVRWQGPSLSTDSAKVATETIEIAHHGFVQSGRS
ncbi:phage tail-like protein [Streptomyces sp. SLBN-118]|uniref:phage tail protein n=1 Tax=Streptomyces sp. SLBN-118 TaxID=2768454 RepID=UPI00114EFFB7|nr:phage tail protein [Streptomyces sp. SLBN-118]TQK44161.1 phage tail-like protein [Streptomyces sp. SLBN-118]